MHNLRLNAATVMWYIIMCLMLVSCGEKPVRISLAERKALDSIVSSSQYRHYLHDTEAHGA